uniref:Uncharacterized protein n=1 Tax=Melanopsichium pennsylvanicum 4 TaxID=1398559 RepID=A0A077RAZ7_9BASI|nr:conserved hypothetical protein [Melanopsichium pennsylvanicum 4]
MISGYSPLPTNDNHIHNDHDNDDKGQGSSRNASAKSSLLSLPLRQAITTLHPRYQDEPYELSEKESGWKLPLEVYEQQQRQHAPCGRQKGNKYGLIASLVGLVDRWKTVILVTICFLLATMLLFQDKTNLSFTIQANSTATASQSNSYIPLITSTSSNPAPYRLEDDLVLITKVGSATVHKRLMIHLAEQSISNVYIPNKLYTSDYGLVVSNITLFDALSNVSLAISNLTEFKSLRDELKVLVESKQNLDDMSEKDGGWKLDKYKFLPMVAEAWRRFPEKSGM